MIDIEKQVALWRESAEEDWGAVRVLLESGRRRHALFFGHLALEKALKAHVCKRTGDLAPRVHDLPHLGEMSGLAVEAEQVNVHAQMNRFNIAGRYQDTWPALPSEGDARDLLGRAAEVLAWLLQRL